MPYSGHVSCNRAGDGGMQANIDRARSAYQMILIALAGPTPIMRVCYGFSLRDERRSSRKYRKPVLGRTWCDVHSMLWGV